MSKFSKYWFVVLVFWAPIALGSHGVDDILPGSIKIESKLIPIEPKEMTLSSSYDVIPLEKVPQGSIFNRLNKFLGINYDFWNDDKIKNLFLEIYNQESSQVLNDEQSLERDLLYGRIFTKIGLTTLLEQQELTVLTILGFGLKINQPRFFCPEPVVCISYLNQTCLPLFFEEEYSQKKAMSFWKNSTIQSLKTLFLPTAIDLFFKPHNDHDYEKFAEDILTKIKTLTFFYKRKGGPSPMKISNFMRSLGVSGINVSCLNSRKILNGGTRIRGHMLPKINLGRNKRRKIMLYDFDEDLCLIKSLPQKSPMSRKKNSIKPIGTKRTFDEAFL